MSWWIGLDWVSKNGPMSNSELNTFFVFFSVRVTHPEKNVTKSRIIWFKWLTFPLPWRLNPGLERVSEGLSSSIQNVQLIWFDLCNCKIKFVQGELTRISVSNASLSVPGWRKWKQAVPFGKKIFKYDPMTYFSRQWVELKPKVKQTVQQHVSCEFIWIRRHVTIFSWMFTIACCLVVKLELGLGLEYYYI